MKKLILHHGLDIGDTAMLTIAVRDLHLAHPGQYQTDVRTRWPDLWLHNPYITPMEEDEGEHLDIGYPLIQNAGSQSFSDAFRLDLADQLGIEIPWTSMDVDIYLIDQEKEDNIVEREFSYRGKFWVLNASHKADAVLKAYPFWQEVVDLLKNKIQIIQVGTADDPHPELENVFSLIGKTSLRDLLKLIYWSEGTIGPISLQFVLATAWGRPSVIIAGGKEPPRWQMYNYHRYLSVCGCLRCATGNGCWTAKYEDCQNRVGGVPRCFAMISPEEVARNVLLYYEGGILNF